MHAEANQGSGMKAGPRDYGDLYLTGRNPGSVEPCAVFRSTTRDAHHDVHVMTASLELEQAIRLRGVPIAPHAVGALIVVGPNVSLWTLVVGWLRERKRTIGSASARSTPGPLHRAITRVIVGWRAHRRWRWVPCRSDEDGYCCHGGYGGPDDSEFLGCHADHHNDWVAERWWRRWSANARAATAGGAS